MRRAVLLLRQHLLSVSLGSWAFAVAAAFGLTGACSVYSTDLLQETTGIATGGTGVETGGQAGSQGGTPSNVGGKTSSETPSAGGDDTVDTSAGQSGSGKGGTANGGVSAGSGGGATGGVAGTESGGSGGTAGSAGGSAGTSPVDPLIDGFDDEDLTLEQTDGRGGVWYLVGDGTVGTVAPDPLVTSANVGAPAELGAYAMHVTATGFTGSGSILGADFRDKKKVYDASGFTGIRFWAKVGAGKNTKHRVQISDATTDAAGGLCDPAATVAADKCDDHFGFAETFTTSWAQYSVTFKQMTQLGWGKSALAINKAAVYGLQVTAKPKLEVDLWLDQIEFF